VDEPYELYDLSIDVGETVRCVCWVSPVCVCRVCVVYACCVCRACLTCRPFSRRCHGGVLCVQNNIAAAHPELIAQATAIAKTEHVDSPLFPIADCHGSR
jgi:hypothetical protein